MEFICRTFLPELSKCFTVELLFLPMPLTLMFFTCNKILWTCFIPLPCLNLKLETVEHIRVSSSPLGCGTNRDPCLWAPVHDKTNSAICWSPWWIISNLFQGKWTSCLSFEQEATKIVQSCFYHLRNVSKIQRNEAFNLLNSVMSTGST